jgi:hypothetical protein
MKYEQGTFQCNFSHQISIMAQNRTGYFQIRRLSASPCRHSSQVSSSKTFVSTGLPAEIRTEYILIKFLQLDWCRGSN